MPSRFLPPRFDTGGKIALLAGHGIYPELAARAIREAGIRLCLIGFEGETEDAFQGSFPESETRMVKVGQLGKMLKSLQQLGATHAMMAGRITPRRLFRGLHPDLRALAILATLKEKNAETIFGAIAREIEARGVTLLDARCFMDDHMALPGMMTQSRNPIDHDALTHGVRIAKEIARLDIGQGVVVRKGTTLVVEGFDGTDAMLRRAASFEADDLLFVKTVKPEQDYRFDVPAFGPVTLDVLEEAGITSVALEAGRTLILDRANVLESANRKGIRIHGYREEDFPGLFPRRFVP